jgi:microcystin-dependent protein
VTETSGDATGLEAFVRSDLFRAIMRTQHADLFMAGVATSGSVPTGAISQYAGDIAPESWLLCNGQEVLRDTYPALYATISNKYGTPSDGTKFKLPNLAGRAPIGAGTGTGLSARGLASSGGTETHTLLTAEMPSHNHTGVTGGMNANNPHGHDVQVRNNPGAPYNGGVLYDTSLYSGYLGYVTQTNIDHGHSISSEGGGGSHNNMQPYLVLNYIIRT